MQYLATQRTLGYTNEHFPQDKEYTKIINPKETLYNAVLYNTPIQNAQSQSNPNCRACKE